MLYQRVLTAIPVAILVIWVILYQPSDVFLYLLYPIALIAAYEWVKLAGLVGGLSKLSFPLIVAATCFLLVQAPAIYMNSLIYIAASFWLMITLMIKLIVPDENLFNKPLIKLGIGYIVITTAIITMWLVHKSSDGPIWLMYGLALVWVADIGAYFAGRRFGKNKLAEKISPGKTMEGLIGGLIFTSIYSLSFAIFMGIQGESLILMMIMSVIVTLVSVAGDLFESVLKREAGVKDSGKILPGHGGLLDRIDSVISAMPVFAVTTHHLIKPMIGA